ncbi:MAG: glycosyltransferase [Myxococcales bacterium]|nr:glycosyltransferase [Myxococcales bacterium]
MKQTTFQTLAAVAPATLERAVSPEQLGVVIIGRNEGILLERALASVGEHAGAVVYVDSASTDDSVEIVCRRFPDAIVVELDTSRPLSPARGRNAGYAALRARLPKLRYVQFVDGDCELSPGWLRVASRHLQEHPEVGVVAGRLRERERERNAYHRLADMEWDQPAGEVEETGGIMMVRAAAWEGAGGQNADMPAAEERELCLRVSGLGYSIVRLDDDMAQHDIDMDQLGQWWERSVRMGHAYAQGLWIHRDGYHARRVLSLLTYGAVLPAAAVAGTVPTLGLSLGLLGIYPRLWRRMEQDRCARGDRSDDARLYATANVVNKVAGALGVARFFTRTLREGRGGRRAAPAAAAQ